MLVLGLKTQRVQNAARLHHGDLGFGVDAHHFVHVLGEVHDDGRVAGLPGQTRAAATRGKRRTVLVAEPDSRYHVVLIFGQNHPDRYLAVVGGVSGVGRAATSVETHLALHGLPQIGGELAGVIHLLIFDGATGIDRDHALVVGVLFLVLHRRQSKGFCFRYHCFLIWN